MKNDLTHFEKKLLKEINTTHGTRFSWKHLMEWSFDKRTIKTNLRQDETIYEVLGVFVAIKDKL